MECSPFNSRYFSRRWGQRLDSRQQVVGPVLVLPPVSLSPAGPSIIPTPIITHHLSLDNDLAHTGSQTATRICCQNLPSVPIASPRVGRNLRSARGRRIAPTRSLLSLLARNHLLANINPSCSNREFNLGDGFALIGTQASRSARYSSTPDVNLIGIHRVSIHRISPCCTTN